MHDKKPESYLATFDDVMTNFDHSIDDKIVNYLKNEEVTATYSAYNFNGQVWWNRTKNLWSCEVWQYRQHVNTLHAESLRNIMDEACKLYGSR